jgi:uncharacterized protein (DUF885 family)
MSAVLEDLAVEYWDLLMSMNPTYATLLGDHRFDDQIEDHSEERSQWFADRLRSIISRTEAIEDGALGRSERITRSMLLSEATTWREETELAVDELNSDQNLGTHARFLTTAPLLAVHEPEHAQAICGRFRQVDRMLESAAERFRAGIAKGRTPARINVERSIHQIDGYVASPTDADPIVNLHGPEGWEGESAWRDQLHEIVTDIVRPAFERYRDVLADELLPVARPDERCGLTWIDGGEELYATLSRHYTTLDLPADEIHQIGRDAVETELPPDYAEIGGRALGISDVDPLLERLRNDPTLRFSTADEMLEVATEALDRATEAIPDWFGRLPQAPCVIATVPEHLADDLPRAYYFPPADDGSRPGTHFVNPRAPEEQNRYDAEAVAFHESIPGHHLQLAIASETDDLPLFQRHALVTAFTEGWGLYSERLSDEMDLYSTDLDRIGMLSGDSWRAGRLVVDTGIHAMGWSRQQAIDYLAANTAVSLADIEVEVDRYIGVPGQALAYKIGELEIRRLRDQARRKLRERFDIQGFHDTVLTHGPVTLRLLGELVEAWINGIEAGPS